MFLKQNNGQKIALNIQKRAINIRRRGLHLLGTPLCDGLLCEKKLTLASLTKKVNMTEILSYRNQSLDLLCKLMG